MAYESRYQIQSGYQPKSYGSEFPVEQEPATSDHLDLENSEAVEVEDEIPFDPSMEQELVDAETENQDAPPLTDVTRDQIVQLFRQVETGTAPTDGEVKLSKDEALDILREAILQEDNGNDAGSLEKYLQVFEVFGSEDGLAEQLGAEPTRFENNTYYFEGNEEENDFSLSAPGTGISADVSTNGNVIITPAAPEDEITLSQEGNSVVISLTHDGTKDVFKVGLDANIHIVSDHVQGEVDNENGNIRIGSSQDKKYISGDILEKIQNKIKKSAGLIGYHVTSWEETEGDSGFLGIGASGAEIHDTGNSQGGGNKYTVGYQGGEGSSSTHSSWVSEAQAEVKDVVEVVNMMGKALSEKDSKRQADLWDKATTRLQRFVSQQSLAGNANNRGALLFNAIYGELGEDLFKFALQEGILPGDFVNALSSSLKAQADEMTNTDAESRWQAGGDAATWTHQTRVDFLDRYTASDIPDSKLDS